MSAFLASCLVAIAVAVGAYYVLNTYQASSTQAFTTQSVRI